MADLNNAGGGGGVANLNQSPVRKTPDPRLPLTPMQVFKLKKNWKGVKRRLEDTGVEMLIRLFRLSPAVRTQFGSLQHIDSEEQLRMSEDVEKTAGRMMAALDEVVNSIEDVDHALDKVARTAEQFHELESDQFPLIEKPFLEAVKIILDDRYTDNMDIIYRILIKFILEHLVRSGT